MSRRSASVLDAYGTHVDGMSVAARAVALAPGHGADLARVWRAKQLEYTWLASLMASPGYARPDFATVTAMALEYACAALVLPLGADAQAELAGAWNDLAPYPDARGALARLAPRPRWILSNGTRTMLDPLVTAAGLDDVVDGVISVDEAGVYKPSPRVYALAAANLGTAPASIAFVSANAWDAAGAQAFGFTAIWINRAGVPFERHAPPPAYAVGSLDEAATIVTSS
jgi:2-haloacid dehalogenase